MLACRPLPSIWRFVYFRVDRDSHLAEDIVGEVVLALVSAAAAQSFQDGVAADEDFFHVVPVGTVFSNQYSVVSMLSQATTTDY